MKKADIGRKEPTYSVGDIITVDRDIGREILIVTKVDEKELWTRHSHWEKESP